MGKLDKTLRSLRRDLWAHDSPVRFFLPVLGLAGAAFGGIGISASIVPLVVIGSGTAGLGIAIAAATYAATAIGTKTVEQSFYSKTLIGPKNAVAVLGSTETLILEKTSRLVTKEQVLEAQAKLTSYIEDVKEAATKVNAYEKSGLPVAKIDYCVEAFNEASGLKEKIIIASVTPKNAPVAAPLTPAPPPAPTPAIIDSAPIVIPKDMRDQIAKLKGRKALKLFG